MSTGSNHSVETENWNWKAYVQAEKALWEIWERGDWRERKRERPSKSESLKKGTNASSWFVAKLVQLNSAQQPNSFNCKQWSRVGLGWILLSFFFYSFFPYTRRKLTHLTWLERFEPISILITPSVPFLYLVLNEWITLTKVSQYYHCVQKKCHLLINLFITIWLMQLHCLLNWFNLLLLHFIFTTFNLYFTLFSMFPWKNNNPFCCNYSFISLPLHRKRSRLKFYNWLSAIKRVTH